MSEPSPAQRFVTGHDDQGRAIFKAEGSVPHTRIPEKSGRDALFGVPWQTYEFPVDLDEDKWKDALTEGGPLHNDEGTLIRVVEFPPQTSSPFHRTISLDYGILVKGQIWLELDDGAERKIENPGDVVVQRGTMHAWHNRTDEWARMVFVLTAAKPLEINGKKIENAMLRD